MSDLIVILGASARAAAVSAVRADLCPWGADLFADADLVRLCPCTRVSRYPEDFPAIARSAPPGAWMYTGGLENYPRLIAEIAASRRLYGNMGPPLRRVRDPQSLNGVAATVGLAIPPMSCSAVNLPRDGTWLRKRKRSSGGLHVEVWDAVNGAPAAMPGWHFQQRMTGDLYGAALVAAGGAARLLGITRQFAGGDGYLGDLAGAPPFHYAGSIGPIECPPAIAQSLERFGDALASRCGLIGLFGIDFILNRQRVWPIEVNPRYPASIEVLERAMGLSAVGLHIAACRDRALPDPQRLAASSRVSGKLILFAQEPLSLNEHSLAFLNQQSRQAAAILADIPAEPGRFSAGSPVVTLLVDGARAAEVEVELSRRIIGLRRMLSMSTAGGHSATSVP